MRKDLIDIAYKTYNHMLDSMQEVWKYADLKPREVSQVDDYIFNTLMPYKKDKLIE